MTNRVFFGKSVFFPDQGILAVGDLHVGYEHAMRESGFLVPESQISEIISDLEKTINEIRNKRLNLKKIVFLGDLKHYFGYEWKERMYFMKILEFLRQKLEDKDIILIKGNHDKFDFAGKKMKNYYFSKGIMFFHGHMDFPQLREERVKTWVIGHLHPSVLLSDKQSIKREKYKCFLTGEFNNREIFVVPSFFGAVEGSAVNDDSYISEEGFSVIPPSILKNFNVHAISDNGEVLEFGKVRGLMQ